MTRIVPDRSSAPIVYCVANGHLLKTVNSGERWVALGLDAADVAIDPSDSNVLLAVPTYGELVFKSQDAGGTWSPRSAGGPTLSSPRILWDRARPNRVFILAFNVVTRSLDAGESWNRLLDLPGLVTALALDSKSGSLYAASWDGIFRLDLDGSSWIPLSGPLRCGPPYQLDVDPMHANVLYAATAGTCFPLVYTSRDGGRNWTTPALEIGSPGIKNLAFDPLDPDAIYGTGQTFGVFRSQDGGDSWSYDGGVFTAQALTIDSAGSLFAGTQSGLFRRRTNDSDWVAVNSGLPGLSFFAVRASGLPSSVYAAGRSQTELWASEDAGMNWSLFTASDLYETNTALTADLSTPGTAYLGTGGCPPRGGACWGSIYKTTDGGRHWQRLPAPSGLGAVQAISVDPARSQILYAAGYADDYAGFRSSDGGATWVRLTDGFPRETVSTIFVDPGTSESVYVGTLSHGVFKSSDGGTSWAATGLNDVAVNALAQDAQRGILYSGSNRGLLASRDAGESWSFDGFSEGVGALSVDPISGSVYAATKKAGVQVSSDGGQTWSAVGSGLPGVPVSDLSLSFGGSILYAATDRGIYVFQFRGLVAVRPR